MPIEISRQPAARQVGASVQSLMRVHAASSGPRPGCFPSLSHGRLACESHAQACGRSGWTSPGCAPDRPGPCPSRPPVREPTEGQPGKLQVTPRPCGPRRAPWRARLALGRRTGGGIGHGLASGVAKAMTHVGHRAWQAHPNSKRAVGAGFGGVRTLIGTSMVACVPSAVPPAALATRGLPATPSHPPQRLPQPPPSTAA